MSTYGGYFYRVTAIGPDGTQVTFSAAGPVLAWSWYAATRPRKLCVNGREYRRRQRARVRRRR